MLLYLEEAVSMPDQESNERSLEGQEGPASAALTVQHSPAPPAVLVPGGWRIEGLPGPVRDAGPSAQRRLLEFFTAEVRNPNTRSAYAAAASRFFQWCETRSLALGKISPFAVASYVEEMQQGHALPTVKQHLSALRALFDYLVVGQILPSNPAAPVRGPRHVVKRGKTPVLAPADARTLLDSIDLSRRSGIRDRALLATMVYSFARVGAVISMNVEDYYQQGKRWWLRLHEKGGKFHQVPAHHNAEHYLDAYLEAAGIAGEKGTPLWRSMTKGGAVNPSRMNRVDVFRMVKRRVRQAELGRGRQLPYLPRHRHHRLPAQRRLGRKRPGHRRSRVPSHHQALRPHGGRDLTR